MCSCPVSFGGGMTSENTRPALRPEAAREALKMPEWIHHCAQCGSNRWGSYTFSICMGKLHDSRQRCVFPRFASVKVGGRPGCRPRPNYFFSIARWLVTENTPDTDFAFTSAM